MGCGGGMFCIDGITQPRNPDWALLGQKSRYCVEGLRVVHYPGVAGIYFDKAIHARQKCFAHHYRAIVRWLEDVGAKQCRRVAQISRAGTCNHHHRGVGNGARRSDGCAVGQRAPSWPKCVPGKPVVQQVARKLRAVIRRCQHRDSAKLGQRCLRQAAAQHECAHTVGNAMDWLADLYDFTNDDCELPGQSIEGVGTARIAPAGYRIPLRLQSGGYAP